MADNPEPLWRDASRLVFAAPPAAVCDWLFDGSSLTRRVAGLCPGRFSLERIAQAWERPLHSERALLGISRATRALVRQVYLCCGGAPLVYARTVIPLRTLSGGERQLRVLGNRPLGELLFSVRSMRRGGVQVARFQPGQRMFEAAVSRLAQRPSHIWGRRSLFYLAEKPLLVSELFLPTGPWAAKGR